MKCGAAALLASVLLSTCSTSSPDAHSGPTIVTFEAHWIPPQEGLPDVYDRQTIRFLLATKCIKQFVFDVKHGVPHDEYVEHSTVARKLASLNKPIELTGKILGPECLDDTLPDFYQRVGAVDQYYIVRYDKEKHIESVELVGRTNHTRIKNLFQRCRNGDHIVARWIF